MFKRVHVVGRVSAGLALVAILTMAGASHAGAYGTDHLYEITVSYNCQNHAVCAPTPFGIGGLWGWMEPDQGGSVDGQLQFQGHANTTPGLNGVGHSTGFNGWSIINCSVTSPPADCGLLGPEGVPTDPNGEYFDVQAVFGTTLGLLPVLTPATPGHYSLKFGPGVFSNATVTQLS